MSQSNQRKVREGVVVSNKMQKTAVVQVSRTLSHPKYRKVVSIHKKYYAHNEFDQLKEGQKVLIRETRPISKLKRWEVVEVMQEAQV